MINAVQSVGRACCHHWLSVQVGLEFFNHIFLHVSTFIAFRASVQTLNTTSKCIIVCAQHSDSEPLRCLINPTYQIKDQVYFAGLISLLIVAGQRNVGQGFGQIISLLVFSSEKTLLEADLFSNSHGPGHESDTDDKIWKANFTERYRVGDVPLCSDLKFRASIKLLWAKDLRMNRKPCVLAKLL